jgi:outer membrane receptor protein involved in Fe transport
VVGYIAPYWTITANYAFNDAKITKSTTESDIGRQKPNAPRHQGNLWTKYTIHKGSLSGLGLVWGLIMWQTAMDLFLTLDLNHKFFQPISYGMLEFIII